MKRQRLDKYISNQLIISRSIVRKGIFRGLAVVNGEVIRDIAFSIDGEKDRVIYDGKKIGYKEYVYILLNKPKGVLSAASDRSRETVVDLVPEYLKRQDIAPVGRLDKDTTGLLLITDDGVFGHNCISPKKEITKSYIVSLDGDINDEMVLKFKQGIVLADGTVCRSAILERIAPCKVRIIITEGKYHQVKRMFGTVGLGVNELHRESIGGLTLPETLKSGECMEMTKSELEKCIFNK